MGFPQNSPRGQKNDLIQVICMNKPTPGWCLRPSFSHYLSEPARACFVLFTSLSLVLSVAAQGQAVGPATVVAFLFKHTVLYVWVWGFPALPSTTVSERDKSDKDRQHPLLWEPLCSNYPKQTGWLQLPPPLPCRQQPSTLGICSSLPHARSCAACMHNRWNHIGMDTDMVMSYQKDLLIISVKYFEFSSSLRWLHTLPVWHRCHKHHMGVIKES